MRKHLDVEKMTFMRGGDFESVARPAELGELRRQRVSASAKDEGENERRHAEHRGHREHDPDDARAAGLEVGVAATMLA